ncbi:MAG: DMT family transporter [Proteobacteria bacterium]|nr:DMT family transporter [Pseudomonadota bacterium]
MKRPLWPAYGALVLTMALWGSNPSISRLVLEAVPPVALAWSRWFVVAVALSPVVWPERRAIARELRTRWGTLLLFAVLASAPQSVVVYEGLALSSAVNLGLFNSAIPVLIIVLGALFWGKRTRWTEMLGVAVSLAGVLVILFQGSAANALALAFNQGDLLIFAAMTMWALYTLKLSDRPASLSPPALVAVIAVFGVALCTPALIAEAVLVHPPQLDAGKVLALLYIGLGPTLGAMLCYNYAVARVGAVRAGALVHLMPVFASLFAVLLLGEHVHVFHAAGFALVAGGALVALAAPARLVSSRPIAKTQF